MNVDVCNKDQLFGSHLDSPFAGREVRLLPIETTTALQTSITG
jgi:hypothetical protein